MIKKFDDKTRVPVEVLVPWGVGIKPYTIRGREEGLVLDAMKRYGQLTFEEIQEQISAENVAFCGVDGLGAHACVKICDIEHYKSLFQVDVKEHPTQLTKAAAEDLLATTDPEAFREKLDTLVVTDSEKKAMAHFTVDSAAFRKLPYTEIKVLEEKTGFKLLD